MPPAMLKKGSSGPAVEVLQKGLKVLGVDPGPIDGVFGPKTEAAVKKFQKGKGLVVDGIVGPKTLAALDAAKKLALRPVVMPITLPKPPPPKGVAKPKPAAKATVKPAARVAAKPVAKAAVKPAPLSAAAKAAAASAAKKAALKAGMAKAAAKAAPKKP